MSLFLLASHWLRSALCLVTPPRVLSLCRLSPSSGSWVSSRLLATNSGRGRDGGGSGDPKEQQKADLARLALERIWGGDSGAAGNGPLPLSSIEGAEEAALAVRSALLNGKRGLVVDVDVSEFDTSGRGKGFYYQLHCKRWNSILRAPLMVLTPQALILVAFSAFWGRWQEVLH